MVTLVKNSPLSTEQIDSRKDNLVLVAFQNNAPYKPVFVTTQLIPPANQDNGTSTDIMVYAAGSDDSTAIPAPDTRQGFIQQLQNLVSAPRLSHRELEVLNQVANGAGNKEIAFQAGTSEQTVKNQMTSILEKLEARNRAHAVTLAIRMGLISSQ
ncbi:MAG: response regulator transcription factor [Anaerolineales bacterium]|nr:response regulator transcription factor [Anaerolineales bacterium]